MLADAVAKLQCKRDPLLEAPFHGKWQLEPSKDAKMKKLQVQKSWDHDGCGRVLT